MWKEATLIYHHYSSLDRLEGTQKLVSRYLVCGLKKDSSGPEYTARISATGLEVSIEWQYCYSRGIELFVT